MASPEQRKKIAVAIVAKLKPKGESGGMDEEDDAEDEPEDGEDDGLMVAARAVRKALDAADDARLAKALRSFVDMCGGSEMMDEE